MTKKTKTFWYSATIMKRYSSGATTYCYEKDTMTANSLEDCFDAIVDLIESSGHQERIQRLTIRKDNNKGEILFVESFCAENTQRKTTPGMIPYHAQDQSNQLTSLYEFATARCSWKKVYKTLMNPEAELS